MAPRRRTPEAIDPDRIRTLVELHAKSVWGPNVRARRKSLGLTLAELSELTNFPVQTLSKVERGQIVARDYLRGAISVAFRTEQHELFPPLRLEQMAMSA